MASSGDETETREVQVIGRLVTPDGVLFEGETDAVAVRTVDGDTTFLSGHIPLVAALVTGGTVVFSSAGTGSSGGEDAAAAVSVSGSGSGSGFGRSAVLEQGGFVEVDGEVVTVSAPVAVQP
ncbi:MAG: hypothetical protein M1420_05950 [Actinobacteria bacterium]|nr:hypothetical protein [Actinomycetota bacterium]